jgi:hypothetical protein
MLHYEELTSNPAKSLAKVLEFCELPIDKAVFDYACEILSPAPPHKNFDLHPAIRPLFEETMTALGYEIS